MATIDNISTSILDLPDREALHLIMSSRQRRRTPLPKAQKEAKKAKARSASKRTKKQFDLADFAAGLSKEQKAKLAAHLLGE